MIVLCINDRNMHTHPKPLQCGEFYPVIKVVEELKEKRYVIGGNRYYPDRFITIDETRSLFKLLL